MAICPDAHLHLFPDFAEIFSRGDSAPQNAVSGADPFLLLNSTAEEDWPVVQRESLADSRVWPFYGIHPWFTTDLRDGWDVRLAERLEANPEAGVGEIGLDGGKKCVQTSRERQLEIFSRQLALATDFSRPVSIHCVRAWDWLWEPMRRFGELKNVPIILHAFAGSPEMVTDILLKKRWNAFFSFAAFQARPEREKWRSLLRSIPTERLLLETDAETLKDSRRIDDFYRVSAETLGISSEELKEIVFDNLKSMRKFLSSS